VPGDDMSKDGARYQPVAWWFTKRRLGRELRDLYKTAEELPPELLALVGKLGGRPVILLKPESEERPLALNRPAQYFESVVSIGGRKSCERH
jgi:hypothetical protein